MNCGIWNTLEGLESPAAVLAEWRKLTGADYPCVEPFLRVTDRLAAEYPCLAEPTCGCRHEVVPIDDARWLARCQCEVGRCAATRLQPSDLVVHELDVAQFGATAARALGLEPSTLTRDGGAGGLWLVGSCPVTRLGVFLGICRTEGQLLRAVAGLANGRAEPFLLMTPTARLRSAAVDGLLTRGGCGAIALADWLEPAGPGRFELRGDIRPVLERFAAGTATGKQVAPLLEGIQRSIDARNEERRELLGAKRRLEAMQADGLLGFLKRIDGETLGLFGTILATGDVAKAARALKVKDSTLRSRVAGWGKRGKPYAALAEFVRWRKAVSGEVGREYAERLASGAERETDYAGLVTDALEVLGELNPENWEERCEDLAEVLRAAVS